MFEELNAHRQAVQENIKKAFEIGFTGNEDLEKAHQVGDIHPNGKWVWTQLPSGKYDWRVIKKKQDKLMATQSQKTEEAKEGTKKFTKPIVPNAVLQYGNLPSRQFDQLYKDFDLQFKSYTKEQLSQAIDKIGDSVSKQISLYKRMKANGDSKIALNKQGNFIDQLSARVYTLKRLLNEKEKQAKSTDDTQSDDKVKLTEGDFKKGVVEKDEYTYTRKNAIDLHDYTGKSIEYYTDNGEKKKAQPYISEFYDSAKQDAVGGYEAFFDRADSIGTFRTLKEAISALETWINNMRVKGHAKPKWIYNESGGRYQMNYRLN